MVFFYLPGGIPVYAFSVFIGISAVIGLAWAAWQAARGAALDWVNAGIWALTGALLLARFTFSAINWLYFKSHPVEALQVGLGGLSGPGGLLGGVLGLALYAIIVSRPFGIYADRMLPLLAALVTGAWLGCWLDGCYYGPELSGLGLLVRDEWGAYAYRFPTQLLGAGLAVGWFWLLDQRLGRYTWPGWTASLGLLGFALLLFGLSFLRVDPGLIWFGLRLDAWAGLGLAVLAAAMLVHYSPRDSRI